MRIDLAGRIVAAMTNTGCAPRPGDDVFLSWPAGRIDQSTYVVVANHEWVGDFTKAGLFQPQR